MLECFNSEVPSHGTGNRAKYKLWSIYEVISCVKHGFEGIMHI